MYSQNNEEEIILQYFKGQIGVFADIGCNDGITLSNTFALSSYGWRGLLVDASPAAFSKLWELYGRSKDHDIFHCALADHDGEIEFNDSGELLGGGDVGLVSTLHNHEMDRFKSVLDYKKVSVPCLTWKTLIEKSRFKHFDFVSLDIEGSEMDVLPHIDLSKTDMICVEFNGNQALKNEYEKYLSGFKLIHTNTENLIYAR